MQQTANRPPTNKEPKRRSELSLRQLLSTRRGTLALAAVTAMLAAGGILAFLQQYRDSVDAENRPVSVLVAKAHIGEGTAGDVIARDDLFQVSELLEGDVKSGTITDPASLRGRVLRRDVAPGEQLVASDFTRGGGGIESQLTGSDRAISVPVDDAHGLVGHVQAGDRVDVLAGFTVSRNGLQRPIVRTLVQDVLVLSAEAKPEEGDSSSETKEAVIRVSDREAGAIAFAADNGKVWLALRPPSNAEQSRPGVHTLESLLVGVRPIRLGTGEAEEVER